MLVKLNIILLLLCVISIVFNLYLGVMYSRKVNEILQGCTWDVTTKFNDILREEIALKIENEMEREKIASRIEQEIKRKIEESSRGLKQIIFSNTLNKRLENLCDEMAKKYTYEHFETELKDLFKDRLKNEMRNNLISLNNVQDTYNPY